MMLEVGLNILLLPVTRGRLRCIDLVKISAICYSCLFKDGILNFQIHKLFSCLNIF